MADGQLNGWAKIILAIGGILVAVAIAYGTLRNSVETNTKDIAAVAIKADASEKAVIGIQKDIGYIKEGIDEIKVELKK